MKTLSVLFSAALILSSFACSKDEEIVLEIDRHILTSADAWQVGQFLDNDHDATEDFAGFTFHFAEDGSLEARKDEMIRSGSWAIVDDGSEKRLVLATGDIYPLRIMWDDWKIVGWERGAITLRQEVQNLQEEGDGRQELSLVSL